MEGSSSRATRISDIVECISSLIDLVRAAKSAVPPPSASTSTSGTTASHVDRRLHKQLDLMKITLRYIETLFFDFHKNVNNQFKALRDQSDVLTQLSMKMPHCGTEPFCDGILDIRTRVMRLKLELVSTNESSLEKEEAENNKVIKIRPANVRGLVNTLAKGPIEKFQHCPGYESFADNYEHLDHRSKRFLLSFCVFPEGATIPMTFLKYWWIGEGFIDDGEKTSKDVCVEILKDFTDKGFILAIFVEEKLSGFRMHPLIRCAVIFLAEESGFCNFDSTWNPVADSSSSEGAYLVKSEDGKSRSAIMSMDPRRVCRLLNVNDSCPELESKWVSMMKSVKVVSLGACTVDGCVKFESSEFLNEFKDMKHVKFLSLRRTRGIYRIPNTINNLTDLKVLDLEECDQLSSLPDHISFLKNLVHLNLERCHDMECMPEGLGSLTKLQVLKGYQAYTRRDISTLNDLAAHAKLIKLSININNTHSQYTSHDIDVVSRMETLKKLKITWRKWSRRRWEGSPLVIEFPRNLEKIDLRNCCLQKPFVGRKAWELSRLVKIYINGGDLLDLTMGLTANERRNVKVLRLSRLITYQLDRVSLQKAFPSLVYLEKIDYDGLSDPDDTTNGIWVDSEKLSELDVGELGLSCNFATKLPNRNVRSLRH